MDLAAGTLSAASAESVGGLVNWVYVWLRDQKLTDDDICVGTLLLYNSRIA
jgi:hypothetical protein